MKDRMYIVTWTTRGKNVKGEATCNLDFDFEDHFAALDNLEDAKELYGLLYLHDENQTTELRLIGGKNVNQRFSYGLLQPHQKALHITLSAPMMAEVYPCVDAVIWNKSKGEGAPPNDLRFEELNAQNGTHIFVHNDRGGQ